MPDYDEEDENGELLNDYAYTYNFTLDRLEDGFVTLLRQPIRVRRQRLDGRNKRKSKHKSKIDLLNVNLRMVIIK